MVQEEEEENTRVASNSSTSTNPSAEEEGDLLLGLATKSEEEEVAFLLGSMEKVKRKQNGAEVEKEQKQKANTNANGNTNGTNKGSSNKALEAEEQLEKGEGERKGEGEERNGKGGTATDSLQATESIFQAVVENVEEEEEGGPGASGAHTPLNGAGKEKQHQQLLQQQQQIRVGGSSLGGGVENGGKMTWASSGKRSDRKKKAVQHVRPVVSPEKAKSPDKSKSPDVLMTSVIETLAQAASVSRSNPGTPQSKLEQNSAKGRAGRNGVGKSNMSPKPRKRLFADDGLAASALLGLASVSNESTGRPAKKGKTTKSSTPRKQAAPRKIADPFGSQPSKVISELAPSKPKARNRRKPEHQRFLGPISPMMKLHKRFSAFKGASSSPNSKVLERQLKLQSSLDGLLGWGDKTPAPPGSILSKIQNCLSPSVRKWCYYEWFYSAIDKLWFEKNKFQEFLDHAGIGKCKKLQRSEWAMIRRSLGKPRRLSLQFLHEERAELEAYRAGVRKHFREKDSSEIPADMPRPLVVGQRVTARHPATCQIHDGSILTVDHANSKYRVQFDRQELGVQQLDDIHIMVRTSTETTPLVPIRKPKIEPIVVSKPSMFTPQRPGLSPLPEPVTFFTPTNQLDSKEMDMRSLAEVDKLLDVKERLLGLLRQMNDEAEGGLHLDENGCTSDQFQQNYALLVRKLRECNDRLKSALVRLQQRLASTRLVSQLYAQPFSSALPVKLSTNDVLLHAKSIIAEAQKAGKSKLKKQLAGSGRKKQRGKAGDDKQVKELISNCINFMYALQICADRCLPQEAVRVAVEMLLQQLKPQSEKNNSVFNEIKKSTGFLLNQLIN